MSIWFKGLTPEDLRKRYSRKTIHDVLGIELTEIGDDFLSGTMPVDERTHQPAGIMHGGASAVLAESLGSIGANYVLDPNKQYAVGIDIHTTHLRSISSGIVTGTARPLHIGRSTQVWEIKIVNPEGQLISVTRLMMFVKNYKATE